MTKGEIKEEAGRRLGDTSTEFLSVLDTFFDWTINDLARDELLSSLKRDATFTVTLDSRTYGTQTITGLTAPHYPLRVLRLYVPGWRSLAVVPLAESNEEFERAKASASVDYRGTFRLWRLYPNRETLEVWPPASARGVADAATGGGATITYIAPPAILDEADEIEEIAQEDLETVIYGMIAKGAPFKEETSIDVQTAFALYQDGKRALYGRTWNSQPGRVVADPFW